MTKSFFDLRTFSFFGMVYGIVQFQMTCHFENKSKLGLAALRHSAISIFISSLEINLFEVLHLRGIVQFQKTCHFENKPKLGLAALRHCAILIFIFSLEINLG